MHFLTESFTPEVPHQITLKACSGAAFIAGTVAFVVAMPVSVAVA
jgi:hypothetical protein